MKGSNFRFERQGVSGLLLGLGLSLGLLGMACAFVAMDGLAGFASACCVQLLLGTGEEGALGIGGHT